LPSSSATVFGLVQQLNMAVNLNDIPLPPAKAFNTSASSSAKAFNPSASSSISVSASAHKDLRFKAGQVRKREKQYFPAIASALPHQARSFGPTPQPFSLLPEANTYFIIKATPKQLYLRCSSYLIDEVAPFASIKLGVPGFTEESVYWKGATDIITVHQLVQLQHQGRLLPIQDFGDDEDAAMRPSYTVVSATVQREQQRSQALGFIGTVSTQFNHFTNKVEYVRGILLGMQGETVFRDVSSARITNDTLHYNNKAAKIGDMVLVHRSSMILGTKAGERGFFWPPKNEHKGGSPVKRLFDVQQVERAPVITKAAGHDPMYTIRNLTNVELPHILLQTTTFAQVAESVIYFALAVAELGSTMSTTIVDFKVQDENRIKVSVPTDEFAELEHFYKEGIRLQFVLQNGTIIRQAGTAGKMAREPSIDGQPASTDMLITVDQGVQQLLQVIEGQLEMKAHPAPHLICASLPAFEKASLADPSCSPIQRVIISAILGLPIPFRLPTDIAQLIEPWKDQLGDATPAQACALIDQLQQRHVIAVFDSPPGAGKTRMAASHALLTINNCTRSMRRPLSSGSHADSLTGEAGLLTATTNDAIENLALALVTLRGGADQRILIVRSRKAHVERKIVDQRIAQFALPQVAIRVETSLREKAGWKEGDFSAKAFNILFGTTEDEDMSTDFNLTDEEKQKVVRNAQKKLQKYLAIIVAEYKPNIILATVAMASKIAVVLQQVITFLVIDEAGQVPMLNVLHLVRTWPYLQHLLLAGDTDQLGVYTRGFSGEVCQMGMKSILDAVLQHAVCPTYSLDVSFRAHPTLTRLISATTYQNKLLAGVSADNRNLATAFSPLPVQAVPLALLHLSAVDTPMAQGGRQNRPQAQLAVALLNALKKTISNPFSYMIVTFYSSQAELLKEMCPEHKRNIKTVDSMQGREADIVVLLTVRSTENSELPEQAFDFIADERRCNVAMSRARHGLFVIGNFGTMLRVPYWKRYAEFATALTPIVDGESYEAILENVNKGQGFGYNHGVLQGMRTLELGDFGK
jgi:hypothetical protein